jgi:hypothetical protein
MSKNWIKKYNLPIPRPPKRTSKLQKKPSALKRGYPTLQNMNLKKFLLLWFIFALLDPDSESGSGSTDPVESGSGSATLPATAVMPATTGMLAKAVARQLQGRQ